MYLPADAQDRLFELVTELSAPGSRIAAEAVGVRSDERRAEMRERFERIADELGIEREFDISELMYNDPDRADVAEWLDSHGWRAEAVTSQDEMRRLGRFVDAARMPTTTPSPPSPPQSVCRVDALLDGPTGWLGSGRT